MMSKQVLHNLFSQQNRRISLLFAILMLFMCSISTHSSAQSWEELEYAVVNAELGYQNLLDQLDAERVFFEQQADEIDDLKENFDNSTVATLMLQTALRELNAMANELMRMQEQTNEAREDLLDLRDQLRSSITAEIRSNEAALLHASPAEQMAIIQTLNELSAQLTDTQEPLASLPSVPFDEILAEMEEDPDELYATADELLDNAARIERQLAIVDQHIEEQNTRRRLSQRSHAYAQEEAFFEEAQGVQYSQNTTQIVANENDEADQMDLEVADEEATLANSPQVGDSDSDMSNDAPERGDDQSDQWEGSFSSDESPVEIPGPVVVPIENIPDETQDTFQEPQVAQFDHAAQSDSTIRQNLQDTNDPDNELINERERLLRELEQVQNERARLLRNAEIMEELER